jgi:hypothetical protein
MFKKTDIKKKREKQVWKVSEKLSNQNIRSLSVISGNKKIKFSKRKYNY